MKRKSLIFKDITNVQYLHRSLHSKYLRDSRTRRSQDKAFLLLLIRRLSDWLLGLHGLHSARWQILIRNLFK